jgi:hypothetical protein
MKRSAGRSRYLIALIPPAVLVAISRYQPVSLQPKLTMAGNESRFQQIIADSGGVDRVRRGMYLDLGFIAVFAATVPALLVSGKGWWSIPMAAAALDLAEDTVVLVLVRSGGPPTAFRGLWVVALVKLIAYAAAIPAVIVAAWRNR